MAMSIDGGRGANSLPPTGNVEPCTMGDLNGVSVHEVTPKVQVGESASVEATSDPVEGVAIKKRPVEPTVEEKPKAIPSLKDYYKQYFSDEKQGAYKLVHCLDTLLRPSASQAGLMHFYCQRLREAVLVEEVKDRQAGLNALEQMITCSLMMPPSPEIAQELVALVWWCRILNNEFLALEAMHIVPEARLCQLCDDIVGNPLFACAESKFLQCRATLIRRHAAEHGNTSALTWLIDRCLISSRGFAGGFTIEEGFRWLHTYRQMVALGSVSVPEGNSVIDRLVKKGRDFIAPDDIGTSSDRERLLLVGLYLDSRFGGVDKKKAHRLLKPYMVLKLEASTGKLTQADAAIAWLWRGILAMPELYKKESGGVDAQQCFKESVRLGCSDGTVRLLQMTVRKARAGDMYQTVSLRKLMEELIGTPAELVAPEVWAVCHGNAWCCSKEVEEENRKLIKQSMKKLSGKALPPTQKEINDNRKKLGKNMEEALFKRLAFASCHGQPEARSGFLLENYVPVYLLALKRAFPAVRGSLKSLEDSKAELSFQYSCFFLRLFHHVTTDPHLLVCRAVGDHELRIIKTHEGEEDSNALFKQAMSLNPIETCGMMSALKIVTKEYDTCCQGQLIQEHFYRLSAHQLLHVVNRFKRSSSITELLASAGYGAVAAEFHYWYRPIPYGAEGLQKALLANGEEKKALALCKIVAAGQAEKSTLLSPSDIKEGKYLILHKERNEKYNLKELQGIGSVQGANGARIMLEKYYGWAEWLKGNPDLQELVQPVWFSLAKPIMLLTTYHAFYDLEDIEKITECLPEAIGSYEECVDKAEHAFALMANKLVTIAPNSVELVQRVKALKLDDTPRKECQDRMHCDQLLLSMSCSACFTQSAFNHVNKKDANQFLALFKRLPESIDRMGKQLACVDDIPELLYYLVPALEASELSDAERSRFVGKAITYLEYMIQEMRNGYDQRIGILFSALQELADRFPKCHRIKNKLKMQFRQVLLTRKDRQWNDRSYWGTNENYNYFINAVNVVEDVRLFADGMSYRFVENSAGVIDDLEWAWTLDKDQQELIVRALEEKSRKIRTGRRSKYKVLIKLIKKEFDSELWDALVEIPVSDRRTQYPVVLILIAKRIAYTDKLKAKDIVSLFGEVAHTNVSSNIYFYWYLWHASRGEVTESQVALMSGKGKGSYLCILELARSKRKDGFMLRAKALYNMLEGDCSGIGAGNAYGASQFEVGEAMLQQVKTEAEQCQCEIMFSNWLKASYHHHPLGLCRLFTCLHPEPNKKFCSDDELLCTYTFFLAEALELPSLHPSAGKEVCRQLLRYKEKNAFDPAKLKEACLALKGAEILILAQLPDSVWPSSTVLPSMKEQLKDRAMDCINQHRSQKYVEEPDIIEGVYIPTLPYYQEIESQLESSVVRPVEVPQIPPEKSEEEEAEDHIHKALAKAFGTEGVEEIRTTVRALYAKYQDRLADLIKSPEYKVHVARCLFRDDHVIPAIKLLKSSTGSAYVSALLQQLADMADEGSDETKEALVDEIIELNDWEIATGKEAKAVMQALLRGAYDEITRCNTFEMLEKLIIAFPDLWGEELSTLQDPESASKFFPYFSIPLKDSWLRTIPMGVATMRKLEESLPG